MNAVVKSEPKASLVAGGPIAAIIPQTLEETFRLANAISQSGLAPKSLDSPEKVMVAIISGAELGMPPFQSIQSFAVINGKPSIWGDGMLAVVRSKGFKVQEWFDNEDAPTKAFCKVTRPDTGEEIERTFSLDDAKKANLLGKQGPWQTNQKRMLQMRARAFGCRDGAADILRGFQMREEVEDYAVREVTASGQGTGMRARLEARTAEGGFDPEHIAREAEAALAARDEPAADAEFSPVEAATFDAEEVAAGAETVTEEEPPFPGDLPLKTGAQLQAEQTAGKAPNANLVEKADALVAAIKEAPNQTRRNEIWHKSVALRTALDKADPERLAEIDALFNEVAE